MPRQPHSCLTPALTLLNELNDAFGPPFIQPISNTVISLLSVVQKAKQKKYECVELMENIHKVLYAIGKLHITSEIEGNKIKQIFRQSEMNTLLKECHTGLHQAFGIFKIETGVSVLSNVEGMKRKADTMHKELLELIATLSDATNSERSSSIYLGVNSQNRPKIFHGRESELVWIMKMLCKESPRIAILGGGGMGKTSLAARAVLHHPDHLQNLSTDSLLVGNLQPTASNFQHSLDCMLD
ncbi:hypothetical protein B0H14DRAFT_3544584 [Mycena olivaceomarginata]|nr:hypothetical protein B0H14DRAFT_3544584 [Mycena olivaceomarginata]